MQEFIHFSLPGETSWNTWTLSETANLKEANFIATDFHGHRVGFMGKPSPQIPTVEFSDPDHDFPSDQSRHIGLVEEAVEWCARMNGKVVCSRSEDIAWDPSILWDALGNLRNSFKHALVYLLVSKKHGSWMGATPELLISREGVDYETVSLAGTRWSNEPFTAKERKEQSVVTESILEDLGLTASSAADVEEVQYGQLRHLKTTIHWKNEPMMNEALAKLHPTPAVAGYPRQEALRFIEEKENHDRGLYTGHLHFKWNDDRELAFVNLRCMQLFRNRFRIFVGGGINAMSDPQDEWEETERKKNAVLQGVKA